jgi:hypothetical protein
MLGAIEQEKLEEAAAKDASIDYLRRVSPKLVTYVGAARHWFGRVCGDHAGKSLVA